MADFDLDLDLEGMDSIEQKKPESTFKTTTPVSIQPQNKNVVSSTLGQQQIQTGTNKVNNPFVSNVDKINAETEQKAKENNKRMISTQRVISSKFSLIMSIISILIALGGVGCSIFLLLSK